MNKNKTRKEQRRKKSDLKSWPYCLEQLSNHYFSDTQLVDLSWFDEDQIQRYLKEELNERETEILRLKAGERKSFEEIARTYSISRERVRQILVKALRKFATRVKKEIGGTRPKQQKNFEDI